MKMHSKGIEPMLPKHCFYRAATLHVLTNAKPPTIGIKPMTPILKTGVISFHKVGNCI